MAEIKNKPVSSREFFKEHSQPTVSELFHENTKLHPATNDAMFFQGNYDPVDLQTMAKAFKQYARAPKIKLPRMEEMGKVSREFSEVLLSRRSFRDFSDEAMNLEEVSRILFQTYGITGELSTKSGQKQYLRASPSAGALYPAEIYLGIQNVNGIEPGIYHYNVLNHELELLSGGNPAESMFRALCGQEFVRQAALTVLITGVISRTKQKYGERGYRYALLDVGHLGQNLYLSSTALNLAVMTTCGFLDNEANRLLKIDGLNETTLYAAFIGKRKNQE